MVSGQVAIGEHIVQIHAEHGAIVNYQAPAERPVPRPRDTPVRRLPRAFDALVGRDQLLSDIHAGLAHGGPAELVGEPGIGKTALLRNVSNHLAELQPDGVVYVAAQALPAADVLQFLFESFYDCGSEVVVATAAELSRYLGNRRALIVVDDAELEREELQDVMNVAASATFLYAVPERRLWGEGRSFDVPGLNDTDARALLERELGRALSTPEVPVVLEWCRALGGSPLRVLQLGGVMRDPDLATVVTASGPPELTAAALDRLLARGMAIADRGVIAPLYAVPAAPVPTETIATATGVGDAAERLDRLEGAHIVVSNSPRYTLAGDPGPDLISTPGSDDASGLAERGRAALVSVVARRGVDRERDQGTACDEAQVLLALVRDAERRESTEDSVALARASDRVLGLSGRWGAWKVALEAALRAASARRAPAEEAWALHQLGSRALGLGDRDAARHQLTRDLELRESLGDRVGAAVTRHNLDLLSGPPPPGRPPKPPRPRLPLVGAAVVLVAAAGAAIAIAVAAAGGGTPTVAANRPPTVTHKSTTTTHPPTKTSTSGSTSTATLPPIHTTTTTTTTKPPPAALQFSPASLELETRSASGAISAQTRFTAENTSSATVTITGVTADDTEWTATLDGCKGQPLASGKGCPADLTLQATDPRALPATVTFTLMGAPAVPVSVTVCLQATTSSVRSTAGPSAAASSPNTDGAATGVASGTPSTGNSGSGTTSTATGNTGGGTTSTGNTTTTNPPLSISSC